MVDFVLANLKGDYENGILQVKYFLTTDNQDLQRCFNT
jgi:hypothetical protein